ncbi:MAG: hypothetical protein Q8K32_11130 [Archangium sp.]|nr:hypothetical protein [Archangium sp.]
MSTWSELDALVAKHKTQQAELVALQKEGGVFRKPRFRPPCVWVLTYGAKSSSRGQRVVFTTFDETKAALEVHALRMRVPQGPGARAGARREESEALT